MENSKNKTDNFLKAIKKYADEQRSAMQTEVAQLKEEKLKEATEKGRHDSEKYIKVVVDAENYRAKRQKTLEQLANRLAAKVIKTKKYVRLEPMNPYERKVIHATLQQNRNITTRSEGEEPYRRVVIEYKK